MRKVFNHTPKKVSVDGLRFDDEGNLVSAPSFFYQGQLTTIQEGRRYVVNQSAINIFDEQLANPIKLYGGAYWINHSDVSKVSDDDYVEFSIVDKDDVLGMFGMYGLSVANGDIIELSKFVKRDYVKKGDPSNGYFSDLVSNATGAYSLPTGLYTRVYYFSYGETPITLNVRHYYYQ